MTRKTLFILVGLLLISGTVTAQSDTLFFAGDSLLNKLLDEVVVRGERPMVKVEKGKLTYDIQRINEGKIVNNAYESLLQLPGVRETNGTISLTGASSLSVILNGKPSTMSAEQLITLLKNMPSGRIEKAEIMYSAPPQYHVRGAAINLVLRGYKAGEGGLQGEVNGNFAQKYYSNGSGGGSLLYTSPKLSVDFLYNANYQKDKTGMDIYSLHTLNGKTHDIRQHSSGDAWFLKHYARLGVDYSFSEKSKLSLVYNVGVAPKGVSHESSKGNYSDSDNEKTRDNAMHNVSLDYTSGFGLNTGINFTHYGESNRQDFEDNEKGAFIADARQQINRWNVYADQSHTLPSEWTLNYGTSFTYANDHNSQFYTSTQGTDLSDMNTDSGIHEYTYNIYGGIEKSFSEALSLSLSVAGEYYKLGSYHTWAVYPTAELTYVASPGNIFQFSFSSDKTYPSYWSTSESIGYLNGYMEIHGNPNLRASSDYTTQLSYIRNSKYVFTLYHTYAPDYAQQLAYQSTERLALIYKYLNWDYEQRFGLQAILPFKLGKVLDSRLTLNGGYTQAKSKHFFDLSFDHSKWSYSGELNNTINVSSKPNIKMELTGCYVGSPIQGFLDLADVWRLDAGMKWTSPNQKAELRLKGFDLFNSFSPDKITVRNKGQHLDMNLLQDSRNISLSFSYKFGGYKEKQRKNVDTSRFGQK